MQGIILLNVLTNAKKYPTQLPVTLQNCRKFWSNIFVTFLVVFALFFANSTTVMVALVAKATHATITVVSFAKNSAKTTRNVTKILLQNFLQFCNVTVSCVGY